MWACLKEREERDLDTCTLHSISRRHHILMVDKSEALPSDYAADDVIVTDFPHEQWDCKAVPGTQGIANVRAFPPVSGSFSFHPPPPGRTRTVSMRSHTCACADCILRKDKCPLHAVTGTWTNKVLTATTATLPPTKAVRLSGSGENEYDRVGEVVDSVEPDVDDDADDDADDDDDYDVMAVNLPPLDGLEPFTEEMDRDIEQVISAAV
jgi:hypothetical protein